MRRSRLRQQDWRGNSLRESGCVKDPEAPRRIIWEASDALTGGLSLRHMSGLMSVQGIESPPKPDSANDEVAAQPCVRQISV